MILFLCKYLNCGAQDLAWFCTILRIFHPHLSYGFCQILMSSTWSLFCTLFYQEKAVQGHEPSCCFPLKFGL